MRKVTKILGKVLSAAVLLLIVLPLALSLLLSINAVQNFVVDRAAQFASRKLETVVRIDRVDIGIFDRITLEGLYVEDYGGDTLLYVGKLHAFITQFGIFSNGFTLRHADRVAYGAEGEEGRERFPSFDFRAHGREPRIPS